jgi:hypothetical protein
MTEERLTSLAKALAAEGYELITIKPSDLWSRGFDLIIAPAEPNEEVKEARTVKLEESEMERTKELLHKTQDMLIQLFINEAIAEQSAKAK